MLWRVTPLARALALLPASVLMLGVSRASADPPPATASQAELPVVPPQWVRAYVQYGVGLAAEGVASAGPMCRREALIASLGGQSNNCILGSGGGVAVRVGWRPSEVFYLGGAYEMTKQDPDQLYRLGILQQARAEARRYFPTGREGAPFLLLGGGVHGYGNEWGIDTWGPDLTAGGGLEVELGGPVLELTLAYRAMFFRSWLDTSELEHDAGFAHFLSFEVSLEAKDAF
jgi:hypothetical protein